MKTVFLCFKAIGLIITTFFMSVIAGVTVFKVGYETFLEDDLGKIDN